MRETKAFTLVELLVVIAVISVLAAMLLPALEEARASATRVYCVNNLRQTGVGLFTYADESRGVFPHRTVCDASRVNPFKLRYDSGGDDDRPLLGKYIELDGLLTCPFSPLPDGWSITAATEPRVHSSYELYAGMRAGTSSLLRIGDALASDGMEFSVLAADLDWHNDTKTNRACAHPDRDGFLEYAPWSDGTRFWVMQWRSGDHMRGGVGRSFLRMDGSVFHLPDLGLVDVDEDRVENLTCFHGVHSLPSDD